MDDDGIDNLALVRYDSGGVTFGTYMDGMTPDLYNWSTSVICGLRQAVDMPGFSMEMAREISEHGVIVMLPHHRLHEFRKQSTLELGLIDVRIMVPLSAKGEQMYRASYQRFRNSVEIKELFV